MRPDDYDAWYRTPRGAWIGNIEYALLRRMLAPERGASILDVGCGTGYFSRRFANEGHALTGIDRDPAMVAFARAHATAQERYAVADALSLPFADLSFDYGIAVTSLCFVPDERRALAELLRVARRGIALGLLNRWSVLYLQKGLHGGSGAYRGAHWHTPGELRTLFRDLGLAAPSPRFAIYLPSGSPLSRAAESIAPRVAPFGAFLAVTARQVPHPM